MSLKDDLIVSLDRVEFSKRLGIIPDEWQEKVLRSNSKRILLNCARQTGKSTVTSILALHRALFYPKSLILLVSPSLRQSSELFRKVMDYLSVLGTSPKLIEENKLSLKMVNGSRIVSLPSKEETIRGFSGVDLIIEDEASRVSDELYYSIRPMLAVSQGRLILMSTPFGKRGHFFEEWSKGEGWEKIKITAYDCKRISREFLEDERRSLGEWWYRQEYECEFTESVDTVFRYEDIISAISEDVKPL